MEKDCFCGVKTELQQIAEQLSRRNWMLGTAESCTGGIVASVCTALSGSSVWFQGGVVSYANEAKEKLLHIDPELIASHGAVSRPVAEAMARNVLEVLDVDVSLAITGIAGPTGGTEEKPVGTVWIAVALRHPQISVMSRSFRFKGDRAQVRLGAAQTALYLVLEKLSAL